MCLAFLTKILILNLNALYQKKKKKYIQQPMSQNRKKNLIRTERTSVIIPRGKDWGLVFLFSRWWQCCVLNVEISGLRELWPQRMTGRMMIG